MMTSVEFWTRIDDLLSEHDLLKHPFYEAWRDGALTLRDLREYASEYYHHVASFPVYLREFASRLSDGELREAVLKNLCDELGIHSGEDRAHNLIWLDFAVGTGALPNHIFNRKPLPEITALIELYLKLARSGAPAETLAALYVYESQVPRVSREKASTLRTIYGLDESSCHYFTLHTTADVAHSMIWREQLQKFLNSDPKATRSSLTAAERAAKALWRALDGINSQRFHSPEPDPLIN